MVDTSVMNAPAGVEPGVCPACQRPVWVTTTSSGTLVRLDVEPHEEGVIELRRTGSLWFAEELAQTEFLFDVEWPRWNPHRASCPRRRGRGRGEVPEPRRG